MARTLRQLIDNCAARSEILNQTDAQWTVWINDGRNRLRDLIMGTDQSHFLATNTDNVTVVDQEDYALPGDFIQLLELDIQDEQGYWRSVLPYRHGDRNLLRNVDDPYVNFWADTRYRLKGTNVSLLPAPSKAGLTIRIKYLQSPTELDYTTPEAVSISGIEEYLAEYIEIWACLQAKMKLESDTLPFERMLSRAAQRVSEVAKSRDNNAPRVLGSAARGAYPSWRVRTF